MYSMQKPCSKVRVPRAEVVKLVDTLASGASGGDPVEVQVVSSAPKQMRNLVTRLIPAIKEWVSNRP